MKSYSSSQEKRGKEILKKMSDINFFKWRATVVFTKNWEYEEELLDPNSFSLALHKWRREPNKVIAEDAQPCK